MPYFGCYDDDFLPSFFYFVVLGFYPPRKFHIFVFAIITFCAGFYSGVFGFYPPWKFHILAFAIIVFLAGFYSGVFESYPPSECHIFDCTAMKFITEATLTGG